ncbi:nucleotidyl transferase AbiEii/AbiGii toxin family protein [Mesotoga sp. BH458_6_3_2_1]|uniref:nucleotidyl transferase AbiEii/AbiGii toxin family protein n=1 Tax=Mesotoga sp. BH458_6_3_2_1 TaxID=1437446 RepID=UPI000EF28CDB|nr:nucleotidyl transferase AbiEii/AbiGii toxin family protein [Mesotoga sp. BH458_6_3_2_1]RLL86695.1 hypothetical protein Y697_08175 [Mesotoga sp. BH458_6_3_2_1]
MITRNSASKEWLDTVMKSYKKNDPGIVEKTIMALTLLEQLSVEGLDFIFKGGTSLMLLLDSYNRFSLDIDILLPDKPKNLEYIFNRICNNGVFKSWFEDKRKTPSDVPKTHYGFVRESVLDGRERAVFLDILYQEVGTRSLLRVPVRHRVIETAPPDVLVTIQTLDALLGDKLTAFAPNTTGIPYGTGKEAEIIKQLFDLGVLFDNLADLDVVRKSFVQNCMFELGYRKLDLSEVDVLNDCIDTAITLAYRGAYKREQFSYLMTGIKAFKAFSFNSSFSLEDAIKSSAKVAYLVQLMKAGKGRHEKFRETIDLRDVNITNPSWNKLKKLKKTDPEAFFYLFNALKLIEQ